MRRKKLGREGELAVKALLEQKGYGILETNFRTRTGEIDIIALEGDILVFLEVKTRASTSCGFPEEAVTFRKQQRIRRLALEYLSLGESRLRYRDVRFDVAAVSVGSCGEIATIRIIEGAF